MQGRFGPFVIAFLARPSQSLIQSIRRQDPKGYGQPCFFRDPPQPRGHFGRDMLMMGGLTPDHRAQGNDPLEPACPRHFSGRYGDLPRTRHPSHLDVLFRHAPRREGFKGALHEALADEIVEPADDHRDPILGTFRLSFHHFYGHWGFRSPLGPAFSAGVKTAGIVMHQSYFESKFLFKKCPIFKRFVSKYLALVLLGETSMGSRSTTFNP